jgi:putative transcription factor
MQCELCGKESSSCKPALIDGVKMLVCPDCARHGRVLSVPRVKVRVPKVKEDIFKEMNEILVQDWNERIKKARIKKGLSREELGFRIGEPTVAITKMENRALRPSDETAKKLEKELGITLFRKIEEVHLHTTKYNDKITLGDILKMKERGEE